MTTFGWLPPTIELPHPQGNTIVATVDYEHAVVYVSDPSDVQPARAWIEHRRAVSAGYLRRAHPAETICGPFPEWTVEVTR
jgi:hypothetical protein